MQNLPIQKSALELTLVARGFFSETSREEWSQILASKDYAALLKSPNRAR